MRNSHFLTPIICSDNQAFLEHKRSFIVSTLKFDLGHYFLNDIPWKREVSWMENKDFL